MPIVAYLNKNLNEVLQTDRFKKPMAELCMAPPPSADNTPERFDKFMRDGIARQGPLAELTGQKLAPPKNECGEFAVPISLRQSLVGAANAKAALETIDFARAPLIPNFAQRMPRSDAKFGIGALGVLKAPFVATPARLVARAALRCA
jgi:hypothetical protein